MPAAMHSVMAGRQAAVPGILIIALGRLSEAQSRRASATVPAASAARVGDTSSDTKPSRPPLAR